jgi:hypothetical protein
MTAAARALARCGPQGPSPGVPHELEQDAHVDWISVGFVVIVIVDGITAAGKQERTANAMQMTPPDPGVP